MEYKLRLARSINPCNWYDKNTPDKGYILAVARLIPMKGITYLIQACANLNKRGLDFLCMIIGDGPLFANLMQEATSLGLEGKVKFMGALPHEQYVKYLANCSFLVVPSVNEPNSLEKIDGLPTVIIEAMSAGKPVVATPIAAIPEIIIDGQTGLLVPCRDVERLTDALERLLINPKLRQTLGKNAFTLSKQEFDHKIVSSQLLSLFYEHKSSIT
jgi:glycosyltransferase involved in cell wall biosynthesis